eukprot:CAMPEP_0177654340 /NCGR_PEP_ID=MMETSP0447-20121125/14273_1 /TAXON_ID=0 /ORGANISM="Stygamoeba regulata, Strain BSH-02190019" /LENGTH=217 /DNA_ID=CAMNT_0019157969 /DNA_START=77 /DNA_END=730 /DNA_ORIENTATION=-
MAEIVLWYWKIPGRASLPYAMLRAANVPVVFSDTEANASSYKEKAPFGQLPVLIDKENNVTMAQSAAITVYAARLAGFDGKGNNRVYAHALQYIELEAELTQFCYRALYTGAAQSPERAAAWEEARQKIDAKLALVAKNLGDSKWIVPGEADASAADFAVAAILWLLSLPTLWPDLREAHPALAAHSARLLAQFPTAAAAFEEMSGWEAYYDRNKSR